MKNIYILVCLLTVGFASAQSDNKTICDDYLHKINILKAQLGVNTVNPDVVVSGFDKRVEFSIVSCKGIKISNNAYEVKVDFIMTSRHKEIRRITLDAMQGVAIDLFGNEYSIVTSSFQARKIYPGVATRGSVVFGNIDRNIDLLRFMNIPFYEDEIVGVGYDKSRVRVKNLKINWNKIEKINEIEERR